MLTHCVHCQEPFNFKAGQLAKIEEALANLQPGKHLRFSCPKCGMAINLRADGTATEGKKDQGTDVDLEMRAAGAPGKGLGRPLPPDVSWLAGGQFEKRAGVVEDVPLALILTETGPLKTAIAEAFVSLSYRPVFAKTVQKALESMRFVDYAAIVFQPEFEGCPLAESAFHARMRELEAPRRRKIFYLLIGPEFHTLYDLEALTLSANLVVNERDAKHIGTILKKGLQDYQDLFGSYLAVLKEHGKL